MKSTRLSEKRVSRLIPILCVGVNLAALAIWLPHLPDRVVTHWGLTGADGWGPKSSLYFLALLPLLSVLIGWVLPQVDPQKENFVRHQRAFERSLLAIALFFTALFGVVLMANSGVPLDVGRVVMGGLGLLWIGLGNFMPQIKHNYTFGVRTPWTLANDDVWRKTHRFCGNLWVVGGCGMTVVSMVPFGWWLVGAEAILGITVVVPVAYSWWISREPKKEQ